MSIGHHVSKGSSYHESILESIAGVNELGVDMSCAQIFIMGPRNYKVNLDDQNIAELRKTIDKLRNDIGFRLFVHGTYLDNPVKTPHSRTTIKQQLELCEKIGAEGLVIHLRRYTVDEYVKIIPSLVEKCPSNVILYLELEARTATTDTTYETPQKIENLLRVFKAASPKCLNNIGICIDTAHLWAAGVNITTYKAMSDWLDELMEMPTVEELGDPSKHILFHLNDQIWKLGGGRDEHAPLFFGEIWHKYHSDADISKITPPLDMEDSGVSAIFDFAELHDCAIILERKSDAPKINARPKIDNIESDYRIIHDNFDLFNIDSPE